jgi:hypothetical protein
VHIEFVENILPSNTLKAYMRTETNPISETLCSLEYWKMDKLKKAVIPCVIQQRQNPIEQEFSSALEIETACSSETVMIFFQARGSDIPEKSNLQEQ